jgi:hypothetical protein
MHAYAWSRACVPTIVYVDRPTIPKLWPYGLTPFVDMVCHASGHVRRIQTGTSRPAQQADGLQMSYLPLAHPPFDAAAAVVKPPRFFLEAFHPAGRRLHDMAASHH